MNTAPALSNLSPFRPDSDDVNAIVDTPQGSPNKYKYDESTGLFFLKSVMPAGSVFPFDFGFIPSTRGGDGDPLDLLILLDASTFVGCVVHCRLIGIITARQTERGKTEQNDRLVGVALNSPRHQHTSELRELPAQLLQEIEHFFTSYNAVKGKTFQPLGRFGSRRPLPPFDVPAAPPDSRKRPPHSTVANRFQGLQIPNSRALSECNTANESVFFQDTFPDTSRRSSE